MKWEKRKRSNQVKTKLTFLNIIKRSIHFKFKWNYFRLRDQRVTVLGPFNVVVYMLPCPWRCSRSLLISPIMISGHPQFYWMSYQWIVNFTFIYSTRKDRPLRELFGILLFTFYDPLQVRSTHVYVIFVTERKTDWVREREGYLRR